MFILLISLGNLLMKFTINPSDESWFCFISLSPTWREEAPMRLEPFLSVASALLPILTDHKIQPLTDESDQLIIFWALYLALVIPSFLPSHVLSINIDRTGEYSCMQENIFKINTVFKLKSLGQSALRDIYSCFLLFVLHHKMDTLVFQARQ